MSVNFFWQLPARGDGRFGDAKPRLRGERGAAQGSPYQKGLSDPRGNSFTYFDYLHQVARAAELSTFDGIKIQHDPLGDEAWIIAGYVARATRTLTLLTEFEASWGSAVYAAKNAVSVQRYTGGRMAWQLSSGASQALRRQAGDPLPDEDVLARIEEFITVARGVIGTAPYSYKGRFFEVREGGFKGTLANHAEPPVFLSGESSIEYDLSARTASVHVLPALNPADAESRVADLRTRTQQHAELRRGRRLEFGVRLDLLVRETEEEAHFDAERYGKQVGYQSPASGASLLWPGLISNSDSDATLVGSYEQATKWLTSQVAAGVSYFLLGAVPHLEEAYRVGAHVLPAVRAQLENQHAA
jgi:alkanesulfonate monooxygenase